jgi:hypothetical protein
MTFPIELTICFPFISLNIASVAPYFTEVSKIPTLEKRRDNYSKQQQDV